MIFLHDCIKIKRIQMTCWNSFLMTLLRILWTTLQNRFWNPIFSLFFLSPHCQSTTPQAKHWHASVGKGILDLTRKQNDAEPGFLGKYVSSLPLKIYFEQPSPTQPDLVSCHQTQGLSMTPPTPTWRPLQPWSEALQASPKTWSENSSPPISIPCVKYV